MAPPRPKIAVSACLLGRPVRYDGLTKYNVTVAEILARDFDLVELCPESELGLGVPRPPIQVVVQSEGPRLVMPKEDRDLTTEMRRWAEDRTRALLAEGVVGLICKARSPSCGIGSTPQLSAETGESLSFGDGLFVTVLRELAPDLPLIEDEALADPKARARFLRALRAHERRRLFRQRPER